MTFSIAFALLALMGAGQPAGSDASTALARLRTLQGSWKGTVFWTGARNETGEIAASYHVSGKGSVVIEDLLSADTPYMTTAYHLDGQDLRMTHYCAAGNQPRLRASNIDLARNVIRFDFVDATNLPAPDAPHVHGFMIHLVDADHLQLEFTFLAKGTESVEHIALTRVGSK
jgi:hypothetical protein